MNNLQKRPGLGACRGTLCEVFDSVGVSAMSAILTPVESLGSKTVIHTLKKA